MWGKAPLLNATAQNGENSSTLYVATVAGLSVVLFCKENEARMSRERGFGLQFLWGALLMEQRRPFLDVSFEGPLRGPSSFAS